MPGADLASSTPASACRVAAVEPVVDRGAAATARAALHRIGYSERGIVELLGDDGPAADHEDVPVLERRLPSSPRAAAIRLLLLQLPVPEPEASSALGEDGIGALTRLGLLERAGGYVLPRGRIMPVEGLLLACDTFPRGAEDPPGYVAAFTPTASWCASLTPRRHAKPRARRRHRERRAGAVRRAAQRPRGRDRRQSARARLHGPERRPERVRSRRDEARQPVRTGRGRDVRPRHL